MNKQSKKIAFLCFLGACIGAYTAGTARDDDAHDNEQRTKAFAKYISEDIDSLVAQRLTADEIQCYVQAYRENPVEFDLWINRLAERGQRYNRLLLQHAALIHKLDSVAGRQLAFSDALQRIAELPDTAPNPSDEVKLRRLINAKKYTDLNIALSRAAKKVDATMSLAAKAK